MELVALFLVLVVGVGLIAMFSGRSRFLRRSSPGKDGAAGAAGGGAASGGDGGCGGDGGGC